MVLFFLYSYSFFFVIQSTPIVIQSEAKDLGSTHVDVLEILRSALNDITSWYPKITLSP